MRLGDGDGFTLLEELRAASRNVPVAIYSGHIDEDVVARAVSLDAVHYEKPIHHERVHEWIETAIERRREGKSRLEETITSTALRCELTPTETRVLYRAVFGVAPDGAPDGDRAVKTVKKHVQHILSKTSSENMGVLVRSIFLAAHHIDAPNSDPPSAKLRRKGLPDTR